jgi:Bacterial TniB protein
MARSSNDHPRKSGRQLMADTERMLGESPEVRRKLLERDCFIEYAAANWILDHLENELRRARVQRQPCILISGEPNNGKSSVIAEFLARHPRLMRPEEETDLVEVLGCEIDSPREIDFFDAVLEGAESEFDLRTVSEKKKHLYNLFGPFGTRMVIIDEIHSMLPGSVNQRRKLWNVIRKIANRFHITVVLVGTDKAKEAIRLDTQLETRFPRRLRLELPLWTDGEEWQLFLAHYEATLPLRKESRIWDDPDKRKYILEHGENRLGDGVLLLQEAAVEAIDSGKERITLRILKHVASH